MTIFENVTNDLALAMKGPAETRDALKLIVAEFQRGQSKTVPDEEAVKILQKLKKDELELLHAKGMGQSAFLRAIDVYLPATASEVDVAEFMKTIDFSKLKNKMQAIGMVKSNFKGAVDSEMVKRMVEEWTI